MRIYSDLEYFSDKEESEYQVLYHVGVLTNNSSQCLHLNGTSDFMDQGPLILGLQIT